MNKIISASLIASLLLVGCGFRSPEAPVATQIEYDSFELASVQYSTKVLIDAKHQTLLKGEAPLKGKVELYRTEIFLKNSRETKTLFLSEQFKDGTVLEFINKNEQFLSLQPIRNF